MRAGWSATSTRSATSPTNTPRRPPQAAVRATSKGRCWSGCQGSRSSTVRCTALARRPTGRAGRPGRRSRGAARRPRRAGRRTGRRGRHPPAQCTWTASRSSTAWRGWDAGHDAQPREPRHVVGVDLLGVLEAAAAPHGLEGVEGDADGVVPDRVDGHVQPVGRGAPQRRLQLDRRGCAGPRDRPSGTPRGRTPSGCRASVDDELHGPDPHAVARQDVPGPPPRGDGLLQPVRPDARGDADGGFGAAGPGVHRRVLEVDQARDAPAAAAAVASAIPGPARRRPTVPARVISSIAGASTRTPVGSSTPNRRAAAEFTQTACRSALTTSTGRSLAEPGVEDVPVRRGVPQRVAVAVADDEVLPRSRSGVQEVGGLGGRARGQDVDAPPRRGPTA